MTTPLVRNRDHALYLGLLLWGAGALLLWDAFENRGRSRPLALRLSQAAA